MSLIVNGVTMPVAKDSWKYDTAEIGDAAVSATGSPLWTALEKTRVRAGGTLVTTDRVLAEALRGMLRGLGYGWSYNSDLYSDRKGLGPEAGYSASRASGGKYGGKLVLPASSGTITYTIGSVGPYTVSVWLYESAAWHHYACVFDGATQAWYRDGSSTSAPTWLTVTGSRSFTLAGGGSGRDFSDLLILPYQWPPTWPAMVASRLTAYPKPYSLEVSGSLMPSANVAYTCRGSAERAQMESRGSLDALERTPFSLQEI